MSCRPRSACARGADTQVQLLAPEKLSRWRMRFLQLCHPVGDERTHACMWPTMTGREFRLAKAYSDTHTHTHVCIYIYARIGPKCHAARNIVAQGHVEHWYGGHAGILHARVVCGWLPEVAGVPNVRHQVEQGLVRRGHLDHQTECWQLMHFPRRDSVRGLERHVVQSGQFEHWHGGHGRILLGRGFCGWLQEDAGFPGVSHHQTRSWQHCKSYREGLCTDDGGLDLMTLTPASRLSK